MIWRCCHSHFLHSNCADPDQYWTWADTSCRYQAWTIMPVSEVRSYLFQVESEAPVNNLQTLRVTFFLFFVEFVISQLKSLNPRRWSESDTTFNIHALCLVSGEGHKVTECSESSHDDCVGQCCAVKRQKSKSQSKSPSDGRDSHDCQFDCDFPAFNFQGCLGSYHIKNISKQRPKARNVASNSCKFFICGSHFLFMKFVHHHFRYLSLCGSCAGKELVENMPMVGTFFMSYTVETRPKVRTLVGEINHVRWNEVRDSIDRSRWW